MQSSALLSPLCIESAYFTIDSTVLFGNYLMLFTNKTVTVVDITDNKQPIVTMKRLDHYFEECGPDIYSMAPIETAHTLDEQNLNTNLVLKTKVSIFPPESCISTPDMTSISLNVQGLRFKLTIL